MAPTKIEVRCDDALKEAARGEAARQGMDLSEFTRGAIQIRLAWIAAVRAIQAGADPDLLLDQERLMRALSELARQQES